MKKLSGMIKIIAAGWILTENVDEFSIFVQTVSSSKCKQCQINLWILDSQYKILVDYLGSVVDKARQESNESFINKYIIQANKDCVLLTFNK